MKSRMLNDQLRSDIVHLATRNLFEKEIQSAIAHYYTLWWNLFQVANLQALNFWCCLPADWQIHHHYQSRKHRMIAYCSLVESEFEVNLDTLQKHVKLPSNFHAFPHHAITYLCTTNTKTMVKEKNPERNYKVVSVKDISALSKAEAKMDEYLRARTDTMLQLQRLLKETRTTKTLLEVWPEGINFLPPVPIPVKQALSVNVTNLTAMLKKGGAL